MSFPTFTLLPPELRLKIWRHALPDSVYIRLSSYKATQAEQKYVLSRCSDHGVPPLLHVSNEARTVALAYYHILGTGSSRAYFDPAVDVIMLSALFSGSINYYDAARNPLGLLGANVSLVRHISYHQFPDIGCGMNPRFLLVFKERLESFAFLDISDWCAWSLTEAREAMNASVFRKEDLVAWGTDVGAGDRYCNLATRVLRRMGITNRNIEVAVMKLHVPPAKKEQLMMEKEKERCSRLQET